MNVLSPYLSMSSVILTDSSTESPVHVLMLSIQAVRGLPRLRAPGIVPCIISFSRQLLCAVRPVNFIGKHSCLFNDSTRVCVCVCVCVCVFKWIVRSGLFRSDIRQRQGPDLQKILRQSYDYRTIMPKLRSTYDGRLIYMTSYGEHKAVLR